MIYACTVPHVLGSVFLKKSLFRLLEKNGMSAQWFITTALSPPRCWAGCSLQAPAQDLPEAVGSRDREMVVAFVNVPCSIFHLSHRSLAMEETVHKPHHTAISPATSGVQVVALGGLKSAPNRGLHPGSPLYSLWVEAFSNLQFRSSSSSFFFISQKCYKKPVRVWICHKTWSRVLTSPQGAMSQPHGLWVTPRHCSTSASSLPRNRCWIQSILSLPPHWRQGHNLKVMGIYTYMTEGII